MPNAMDHYVARGKSDVQDKLREGTEKIERIGDEFQHFQEGLQDMPGGLDADLLSMIQDAGTLGRIEALRDIEAAERAFIDPAKSTADTVQGDVQGKLSENAAAKGKLERVNGKYGRDAIARTKSAIDANSHKGEDLLMVLEHAIRDTDQRVESIKDKIVS